jgi:pimeloyl-ACP methyl ester carboxylesterase
VRSTLAPLFELALDVMNYFPPMRGWDRIAPLRWMLGGTRRWRGAGLAKTLQARLRSLLAAAGQANSGRPVHVLAHSLGSIIALSALEKKPQINSNATPVTLWLMGSPIALLSVNYPAWYGDLRSKKSWDLSNVEQVRNRYCEGDLVGRNVSPWLKLAEPLGDVDDHSLGDGGHTGYFQDPRLAKVLLGQLLGPATKQAAVNPP